MVTKDNVRSHIESLVNENYRLYGSINTKQDAFDLAKRYWETRREEEIHRDKRLGISLRDYEIWVLMEHEALIVNDR